MASLDELYQSVILDHHRAPRNFRVMDPFDRTSRGYNPLCGDTVTLWLRMDGDRIADVSFQGQGCAISKASASLMTMAVQGKTRDEAMVIFRRFHAVVTGEPPADDVPLGKLEVFRGVAQYPVRVKCASLAWHALKDALES
jgi:nitrogen fixation NifU-like protein